MKTNLDYGADGLVLEVPDGCNTEVVDIKPAAALPDADQAVREALGRPAGSAPLEELARGKRAACVVVSDMTRPVPNRTLLPPILASLKRAGLEREHVTILIATGLHRPMTSQEIAELLGNEIAAGYRVVNHLSRDPATNVHVGETSSGAPVWLDKTYVASDLRILTGLVEPHLMAGYSGGPKAVGIGLSTLDTIRHLHGPRIMEHPKTRAGQIQGNQLQRELHEVTNLAPPAFTVNVTLSRERQITGVFAGDMEKAHRNAIDFIESYARVKVAHEFDIVVTTNAGAPLDINFYQCVKGLHTGACIVRKGGTILMAARCPEGLGSDEFARLMVSFPSVEQAMSAIMDPKFFELDQWAVELVCQTRRKAEVLFYTEGVPAGTLSKCLVTPVPSMDEGLRMALEEHGSQAHVAIIPKGPYVVVEVE